MKGFFQITEYLDRKYGFHSTDAVRRELSKYSYPVLAIQRKRGIATFLKYAWQLRQNFRLDVTPYFHVYTLGLALAGEANCDRLIRVIKRSLGRTPEL